MGNTVPPRMCREAGTAVVARQRPSNFTAEAAAPPPAPRRVAVAARNQQPDDVQEQELTRAGRRRGGVVPRAGGGEAATVLTVKLVLKRKDAEELVARLNAQAAWERKARMAELKGELRAADGGGGGPVWRRYRRTSGFCAYH
jgi:hypothetical protein